jgi:uncharacterized protein (DUF952 family)
VRWHAEAVESIFHLVSRPEWQAATEVGRYAPESLATEGFVHFSFAHQVAETANYLFAGRDDLIVIEVDPTLLDAPVVLEDLYGMGEEFPHVYAAIPTAAAVAEHPINRDPSRRFTFGA